MKVIERIDLYHKDDAPVVVALGNFDGVHKGHQEIFKATTRKAHALHGKACVITFRDHPQHVLHAHGKPLILSSFNQRLALFEEFGIERVFLLNFTEGFAHMQPKEFVEDILVKQIGVSAVCMGFNARFGTNRSGDVGTMKEYSIHYGFDFIQVGPVSIDGQSVSSSAIREMLWKGDLDGVKGLLGREFSTYGQVVRGSGIGAQMGFPTANLDLRSEVLPPKGVYAVRVNLIEDVLMPSGPEGFDHHKKVTESNLAGVLNYGTRPTVTNGQGNVVAEVHLIGWSGDLYGKTIEVRFLKKIRDERKFADKSSLSSQIKDDIKQALELIKK